MTHWLIVAIVVLLLFGRGKISELMGDVAKGIKSFKKGLNEDEAAPAPTPKVIDSQPQATATPAPTTAARAPEHVES
jgi:sec-independent protein translocase protein TatA